MQNGELTRMMLYYTFKALLEANYGHDTKSNLPSSLNVVMPCKTVEKNMPLSRQPYFINLHIAPKSRKDQNGLRQLH